MVLTKKGWVYFLIREYPEDRSHYKDEESICKDTRYYVLRVDPVNDTSEAIKLQPGDGTMSANTANLVNMAIKLGNDGCIYQLQMNLEGFKILKYTF